MKKGNDFVPQIDFEELIKEYRINDNENFNSYLSFIWKDLACRNKENDTVGISKNSFLQYFSIPGIINERIFTIFDEDYDQVLNMMEFICCMNSLYTETLENLENTIFKIYDFDEDGYITKEDVRVIFSYIPLSNKDIASKLKFKFESLNFRSRIESQEELYELIGKMFPESNYRLNLLQFKVVIQNLSSEVFLYLLMLIMENKPFSNEMLEECKAPPITSNNLIKHETPMLKAKNLIASPNINSRYSPSIIISKTPLMKKENRPRLKENQEVRFDDDKSKIMQYFRKKNKEQSRKENKKDFLSQFGKKKSDKPIESNTSIAKVLGHKDSNSNLIICKKCDESNKSLIQIDSNDKRHVKKLNTNVHFVEDIASESEGMSSKLRQINLGSRKSEFTEFSKFKAEVENSIKINDENELFEPTEEAKSGSSQKSKSNSEELLSKKSNNIDASPELKVTRINKIPNKRKLNDVKKNLLFEDKLSSSVLSYGDVFQSGSHDRRNSNSPESRDSDVTPAHRVTFSFGRKDSDITGKSIVRSGFSGVSSNAKNSDTEGFLSDLILESDEDDEKTIRMEGFLFKITKTGKFKSRFFKMINKDMFYFKTKNSEHYEGLHYLSEVYLHIESKQTIGEKEMHCFSLSYIDKKRYYYCETEIEFNKWIFSIQKVTGYEDLNSIYEIQEQLGIGEFGIVKVCVQRNTGRKAAIKIIHKRNLKERDLNLVRTEIEILKISQHPNIIKLYDILENDDYIYIIMELCTGDNLYNYLIKREFKISEKRASILVHKIAAAVYYLHSYGIIHRDLKLDNILMTDETDDSDLRILDFGLSKILGPKEKCYEAVGSLSYVAPEVLKKRPYDTKADIWSLGIIAYILLTRFMPFNSDNDQEIIRQTVEDPVPYPSYVWNNISKEAKVFVNRLLQKDPNVRIGIEEVLEDNWILNYMDDTLRDVRKKYKLNNRASFEVFAVSDNKNLNPVLTLDIK